MYYDNEYHYNPYSYHNRVERYIPMNELPFLRRIARMMYMNSLSNNYNIPQNSFIEFMRKRIQNTSNNGRF